MNRELNPVNWFISNLSRQLSSAHLYSKRSVFFRFSSGVWHWFWPIIIDQSDVYKARCFKLKQKTKQLLLKLYLTFFMNAKSQLKHYIYTMNSSIWAKNWFLSFKCIVSRKFWRRCGPHWPYLLYNAKHIYYLFR